jgi:hypothetical protein
MLHMLHRCCTWTWALPLSKADGNNFFVELLLGAGCLHCTGADSNQLVYTCCVVLGGYSAQVLHIDLGIAFEQGMFLSTPERVPFRLTANVVDGMGAAGLEGTFRRCCETTLQVRW